MESEKSICIKVSGNRAVVTVLRDGKPNTAYGYSSPEMSTVIAVCEILGMEPPAKYTSRVLAAAELKRLMEVHL